MALSPETQEYRRRVNQEVASRISAILYDRRMSQSELARITGIHRVNIGKMLNGQYGIPANRIKQIADALHVEVGALLTGSTRPVLQSSTTVTASSTAPCQQPVAPLAARSSEERLREVVLTVVGATDVEAVRKQRPALWAYLGKVEGDVTLREAAFLCNASFPPSAPDSEDFWAAVLAAYRVGSSVGGSSKQR